MSVPNYCPYCRHVLTTSGHYVPPMMGDAGFWACAKVCEECKAVGASLIDDERGQLLENVANAADSLMYAAPEVRDLHMERLADALKELHDYRPAESGRV